MAQDNLAGMEVLGALAKMQVEDRRRLPVEQGGLTAAAAGHGLAGFSRGRFFSSSPSVAVGSPACASAV